MSLLKGALVEYTLSVPPATLVFEFNPQTITRTRTLTLNNGQTPGVRNYAFSSPMDAPLVARGVSVENESFSVTILLDATDRMAAGNGVAQIYGVGPELDTLRTMLEPKSQSPDGKRTLASLGLGEQRAFQTDLTASVLLFAWGPQVLPVFLTSINVTEKAHLPSLKPYRAEAQLTMQVIEGDNPFYLTEQYRQVADTALNTHKPITNLLNF